MIQDIFPHVYHNEYHDVGPKPESIALYYEGDTLLIRRDKECVCACGSGKQNGDKEQNCGKAPWEDAGVPVFPRFADFENNKIYENATYLFTVDEDEFFLVDEVPDFPHGFSMEKIASLLNKDDHYPQFAAVTGRQLRDWYRDRKYCGRCGKPLKKDTKERMLYCDCGQIEYPKISPAVIVAVLNGDKILLSRYAGREYTRYGLTAGFCEIGETVEDTVRREVMEEVGLRVKNIRFYKSQPWSFSNSVLIGFFCDLDGSDEITVDTNELSEAVWVERGDIPAESRGGNSLTEEMMQLFRAGKEK